MSQARITETTADIMPANGVLHIPDSLSDLNTEPKCVLLASVPEDEEIKIAELRRDLRERGAFNEVSSETFQISGIAREMDGRLLAVRSDGEGLGKRGNLWARRFSPDTARAHTVLAGMLLGFSIDTDIPLRKILGERLIAGSSDAVKARIRTLEAMTTMTVLGCGTVVSVDLLDFLQETQGIDPRQARRYMNSFTETGIMTRFIEGKNLKFEFIDTARGDNGLEIVQKFFGILNGAVVKSPVITETGLTTSRKVLDDPKILSNIVARSYNATNHFGKTS